MDACSGGMYIENRVDNRARSVLCNVPLIVSVCIIRKRYSPLKIHLKDQRSISKMCLKDADVDIFDLLAHSYSQQL